MTDQQTRDGWRERLSTLALQGDLLRMADEAVRAYEENERLRAALREISRVEFRTCEDMQAFASAALEGSR